MPLPSPSSASGLPAGGLRCLLAVWLWGCTSLHAHHGRDFILVQDSAIPAPLHGVVTAGMEWTREGTANEWSVEPGMFIGLGPALAVGLSGAATDSGTGWSYTGVTPQFVLSLLPATGPRKVRLGLWAGHEFSEPAAGHDELASPAHVHAAGGGPDAGSGGAHHHGGGHDHGSHSAGIHRHGESGLHSRMIFEADLAPQTRIVLNVLSFASTDGGKPGFGYALGIRRELSHRLLLGVEALGDFEERQSVQQVLLTGMFGLTHHLALRLGIGGGLTPSAPDFILHTGLVHRF